MGTNQNSGSLKQVYNYFANNPEFYSQRGLAQVAFYGQGIALVGGASLVLTFMFPQLWNLFLYISIVCLFHSLEFYMHIAAHPGTTTSEAYLLNHSPEFNIAMIMSLVEYITEYFFFDKSMSYFVKCISFGGILITFIGQIIRSCAMYTAGKSFTHLVANTKKPEHKLVTSGIYGLSRHPSYDGWYLWAVFSQVILLNPLCVVAYAVVAYKFFKSRIEYEEKQLIKFFGDEYIDYKTKVPCLIPFIDNNIKI